MRGYPCLFALTAFLSGAVGCPETPESATQVVVLVGGDPRIDELEITVLTENGRTFVRTANIELVEAGEAKRRLPTSFTLIPADFEHPEAHRFRLVVTGWGDGARLVRSIVIGGFSAGQTTLLPLVLSSECIEELCGCTWEQDACEQTCLPSGIMLDARCAPVPDHRQLAQIEPGAELGALARGIGGCGRGAVLDASGQCADLDECAFGLDDCDAEPMACVNELSGAFGWQCRCPDGFQGDGIEQDGCR